MILVTRLIGRLRPERCADDPCLESEPGGAEFDLVDLGHVAMRPRSRFDLLPEIAMRFQYISAEHDNIRRERRDGIGYRKSHMESRIVQHLPCNGIPFTGGALDD